MQIHLSNKCVTSAEETVEQLEWDIVEISAKIVHTKTLDPEVAVNTRRHDDAVYTSPVLDPEVVS